MPLINFFCVLNVVFIILLSVGLLQFWHRTEVSHNDEKSMFNNLFKLFFFSESSKQGIFFPSLAEIKNETPNVDISMQTFLANINQCAEENQIFCTKNDNYPLEYIETLLENRSNEYIEYFRVHGKQKQYKESVRRYEFHSVSSEDKKTYESSENVIEMCDSYEKVIYPTSGINGNGVGLYILNSGRHKQGVRVSMCTDPGKECENYASFRNGYSSKCQQKSVYFELLSLSPNGEIEENRFKFPASCSCVIVRNRKRF